MEKLLISAKHGQMINTELFDCDYYDWLAGKSNAETKFEEEFLSEYTWGEFILSDMISRIHKYRSYCERFNCLTDKLLINSCL